jgi:hypothetical protein
VSGLPLAKIVHHCPGHEDVAGGLESEGWDTPLLHITCTD